MLQRAVALLHRWWSTPGALKRPQIRLPTVTLGGRAPGDTYGSWAVSPLGLSPDSVVYSAGVGEDASFDAELISRFGVTVHAFDPTPRSIEWAGKQTISPRWQFHPYGVADRDGELDLYAPDNPAWVSHTLVSGEYQSGRSIRCPVRKLSSIMNELGHHKIDLLKLDIEGAEYGVIFDLLRERIEVIQLLVEFHHQFHGLGVRRTIQAINDLNAAGYRTYFTRPDEIAFIKGTS